MLKRKAKIAPPAPPPPSPRPPTLIETHVSKALEGIRNTASAYDKAAALNAYVHLYLSRASGSTARTAEDVLKAGEAICGGMSLALIRMLEQVGLKADYAFTYGGLAAHSMVEVMFTEAVHGLFDPYHGVAFYSQTEQRPLSILEIENFADADPAPIFYVRRTADMSLPLTRANAYSEFDEDDRQDFAFPGLFTEANGVGIANSGFVSFINVDLVPGETMGNVDWTAPTDTEPRPWTTLSGLRRETGEYVSWAYLLGHTALGYRIEHAYALRDLIPGHVYVLTLKIANIYARSAVPDEPLALTLQPVSPFGKSRFYSLELRGFREEEVYSPTIIEYCFEATAACMTIMGCASGDLVLQSISLKDNDQG